MDKQTLVLKTQIELSTQRVRVLKAFENEDYQRPIQIAKKLDLHPSAVSNNLKKLCDRGYVYLMNPDYHMPRLYRLTDRGKYIINFIDDLD